MCLGISHPSKAKDVEYFDHQAEPRAEGMRVLRPHPIEISRFPERNAAVLSASEPLIQRQLGRCVVSSLMDKRMCQILAYLNAQAYDNTKRLSQDRYAYADGANNSPASRWLKQRGIISQDPFVGVHGAGNNRELDYPGHLAYRIYETPDGGQHVDLYITFRGSQGEIFQPLGGIAGPSWFTNFDAAKITVPGTEFGISDKYFKPNTIRQISLHQGYAQKFAFLQGSLAQRLNDLFRKELNLPSYNTLAGDFLDKDKNLAGIALKSHVDRARKCTVQVYCTGHSQGGGVAQVAVAFLTTYIGEYLYGPNFDNKEFNLVYGIFMSPARAWGDKPTRAVYENVVGVNNMVGYSTVMDIVTCMPLGHNIEEDPAKAMALSIGKRIIGGIATFFGTPYADLVKLICSSEHSYETLTHWCFEDPVLVFTKYCRLNIATIDSFVRDVKAGKLVVANEAQYVKSLLAMRKNFEDFVGNAKNSDQLRMRLQKTQDAYFIAHRKSFIYFLNKPNRNYHALKAMANLKKVITICSGPEHFIASQHFGAYAPNHTLTRSGLMETTLEPFFNPEVLSFDLQQCAENADSYFERKNRMIEQ
ncbi:MAG: hypothetical protein LBF43_01715 [Puniceicoccales bacterium]|jgi:hypothetical protein|nr:hypothetical protein [Puniceicoccales bacterium]